MITKATQTPGDDNPVDKDEDLVQKFNNGDLPAFNTIYKQYFLKLYYFTFKLIKDDQEAKAIVSETMEKLWKLRGNFETMADIRGFLYTVSNNAAYDFLKYNNHKKEILVADVQDLLKNNIDDPDTLAHIARTELMTNIYEEIKKLPPQRKKVLQLIFSEGFTTKQVAEELGMKEALVYVVKAKALDQLRKRVGHKINDRQLIYLIIAAFELQQRTTPEMVIGCLAS